MNPSLKQLRYFVALAETGGFGRAAEIVHVTQPALSQQIKELETILGVELVERLPRGVRLTRAGREVLERSRRIMAEVADLERAARMTRGLSGRLRLGVIPTVAPYLLPLALTRLRARDLTLDIRVREAQTEALLADLEAGRIDAMVAALPVAEPNLAVTPLITDRFVLAGTPGRLARWAEGRSALRPDALAPDQLLLLDEGHCLADQALEVCGLRGRGRVDLGASSLATLTGLVAEGFGLTLLPEIALRAETAAAPGLALRRFADPEPARELALIRRAGGDDGWVAPLAALLGEAGAELLDSARAVCA
ncbi:LysR family hydrogen peroxide-inducible transcriptional activator [Limimaricola variabilis]|uniref:LysR family hydrogen peroxide-inducible transcriptional activator n=1 Tax=Limimaricola variabilis TaxID=1492771 RepID=A0ABR6HJG1_9RHOB|nr:hydrogen peroxide-inducible genes activator [Limimaricola variabilis]MBB3710695.1 LysR family hydrogen peroxide-inducible transcriptional activator [Limimaricola variabilis]WPY95228.1 LysR substrate-binding domain-containing protein [Limimaricola variabilis]